MRIGELAKQAGVNIQTIRFYERRGLLRPPRRLASSYRDYPAETVKIVAFIKRSQHSGFTLREIKAILEKLAKGTPGALNRKADLQQKIDTIDEQIRNLQELREHLTSCLSQCVCGDGETPCPGAVTLAEALKKR